MGQLTYGQARVEFARRIDSGEFVATNHKEGRAASQYTTAEMVRMENGITARMREGNHRDYGKPMMVSPQIRIWTEDRHPELNKSQLNAVDEIFLMREKIIGLEGAAGTGKTTTLAVVREGAETAGYRVEGFAPTFTGQSFACRDQSAYSWRIAIAWCGEPRRTYRQNACLTSGADGRGPHMGAAVSGQRYSSLLAQFSGDRHQEGRILSRSWSRCAEKSFDGCAS
jgi:hypothetical protein